MREGLELLLGRLAAVLVARPESARFVVSRVWFRFVSPDPPPLDVLGADDAGR